MEIVDLDRANIPQGWYDLVILGRGWEAIGSAWQARSLGARVAIVPGLVEKTEASCTEVPRPLCQCWNLGLPGWQNGSEQAGRSACWGPPEPPFVEGLPLGGRAAEVLATDKALGQLAAQGVAVFRGPACFLGPDVLEVQGHPIPFRKVLLAMGQQQAKISPLAADLAAEIIDPEQLLQRLGIALPLGGGPEVPTGAEAAGSVGSKPPDATSSGFPGHPPQPAQEQIALSTKEAIPRLGCRVAFFGAGPDESVWAQRLARQGCQVHLITSDAEILPDHNPEVRQWVQTCLLREDVRIHCRWVCRHIQPTGQAKLLLLDRPDRQEKLVVDFLVGLPETKPAVAGWQLERAGVFWGPTGVWIDRNCRTNNRRIFAAGAVCGSAFRCPRIAWTMLRWAVAKALGRRPPRRDWLLRFRCIPTDPPVFCIGQSASEARQQGWSVETYRVEAGGTLSILPTDPTVLLSQDFSAWAGSSAAQKPGGFLQVHLRRRSGRIVGATLAGPWAHELADLVAFLIHQRISLPKWTVPTGCVAAGVQLLEEAARLAREDHRPHWWDLPLENLQRLWQKWKDRSSAPRQPSDSVCPQGEQKETVTLSVPC